jgi:lipid-binding SYLF domain-containing protein
MTRRLSAAFLIAALALVAGPLLADTKTDARLEKSRIVFEQFADISEQQIPYWLLERAYGVAVIPDVIKGAFVLGGRGGRGVLSVRNADGSWSAPVFITLAGVNVGFQWGVQSTDVVLVFLSRPSVEGIAGGKITLGADASVAAGPVGRSAAATTDAMLKAQVLSYSRNEGLFAGVALDGSWLAIDDKSNATAYNWSDVLPSQILEGKVGEMPPPAAAFTAALTRATSGQPVSVATPATTAPAAAPATVPPPASTDASPAGEAQTFPLEDPNPGAPPPQ